MDTKYFLLIILSYVINPWAHSSLVSYAFSFAFEFQAWD